VHFEIVIFLIIKNWIPHINPDVDLAWKPSFVSNVEICTWILLLNRIKHPYGNNVASPGFHVLMPTG